LGARSAVLPSWEGPGVGWFMESFDLEERTCIGAMYLTKTPLRIGWREGRVRGRFIERLVPLPWDRVREW